MKPEHAKRVMLHSDHNEWIDAFNREYGDRWVPDQAYMVEAGRADDLQENVDRFNWSVGGPAIRLDVNEVRDERD